MKRPAIAALISAIFITAGLLAANVSSYVFDAPPVVAAGATTNLTATTALDLTDRVPADQPLVRMGFTFTGTPASTNGNVTVFWAPSLNGTNYDDASATNVKLSVAANGSNSVTISDLFNVAAMSKLRVVRVRNNSSGPISNLVTRINVQN